MRPLLGLFFLLQLCACSMIEYTSSAKIPVHFTYRKNHEYEFKLEQTEGFYLFGFLPEKRVVLLDELLEKEGLTAASKIQIHESLKFTDALVSVLSLGLYTPRSFTISGRGSRE